MRTARQRFNQRSRTRSGRRLVQRAAAAPFLPEREAVRLRAGVEEFDLEPAVGDRARLADQLIRALVADDPAPVGVHIGPARRRPAGCPSRNTRNGIDAPVAAGPMTRLRSRAWNRNATAHRARSSTAACWATVQVPASAQ